MEPHTKGEALVTHRPHGRKIYVINLNRGDFKPHDPQWYLDISVMPQIAEEE